MQDKADGQLLREYALQGSEEAFGEIVARYTDLVYSSVLRQAGSADLAEEVAQSVFTDLAHKAPALASKFPEHGTIVGWLYRSSRYALSKHLRAEHRRHSRESQAMQNLDSDSSTPPHWERVYPVLDEALADLNEEDRQAMLLRFFQNKRFEAVGTALGISDDAAQKRVGRALEKLRASLVRRGIVTTAAMLSAVLSTNAVHAAPAGLAARLAGTSLAGAAAKTATTLTLMTLTSFKTGIVATGIAAALAIGLVAERRALNQLQEEDAALRQQISQLRKTPQQPIPVRSDNGELEQLRREQAELLRLRGEIAVLRATKEKQQLELASANSENAQMKAGLKMEAISTATVNTLKQIGSACRLYAEHNNNVFPTDFAQIQNELGDHSFASNIGTNLFEFVDYGQPVTGVTNSSGKLMNAGPYFFLAREKQARQLPWNQKWERNYLFFDGSVQRAESEDGNYDSWEREWIQQATQEIKTASQ